jgi:hypothetical protein
VYFLLFFGLVKFVSARLASSSSSPPQCCLSSDRRRYVTASCHDSVSWSQDEVAASASSFGNASSCRLPSRAKIEALNPHHRRWPPSLNCPTHILHCYRKIILILIILIITQSCFYFASSIIRVPCHRSSIRHCHSFSPSSYAYHSFTQRHSL